MLNTTVTLTGSSQIALARHPRTRANTAVAAREPGAQYAPQYGGPGDPIVLTPRQPPAGQYAQRPDDGYIYPADGSSDGARYPAPRIVPRKGRFSSPRYGCKAPLMEEDFCKPPDYS